MLKKYIFLLINGFDISTYFNLVNYIFRILSTYQQLKLNY